MTKKQKILELFNSIEWHQRPTGEWCKSISKDDFESVGLYGDVENSQQHCDILQADKFYGLWKINNQYKKEK